MAIPQCEADYQKLQALLREHREKVRNKKTNIAALDQILKVLLLYMDRYGDEVIPRSASALLREGGIDNGVYDHNFGNMNGIILATKGVIVDGIDRAVHGAFGVFSYDDAVRRVFEYLLVGEDEEKIYRMRFIVRRFPPSFWEIALHSLYPLVAPQWAMLDEPMQRLFYSRYAAYFWQVLVIWMRRDFSAAYVQACMKLPADLNGAPVLLRESLKDDLRLFG